MNSHIERISKLIERQDAYLQKMRDYRMMTGLASLTLFSLSVYNEWQVLLLVSTVGLFAIFPYFVARTRRVAAQLDDYQNWRDFLFRGQLRKAARWSHLKNTSVYVDRHSDIDLFGFPSLFSFMDETITEGGERQLEQDLTRETATVDEIYRDQNRLKSLSSGFYFVRKLLIAAWKFGGKLSSRRIAEFVERPLLDTSFLNRSRLAIGVWFLAALSYVTSYWIPVWPLPPILLIVYWMISFSLLPKVASSFQAALGIEQHYRQFGDFLALIETACAKQSVFAEICPSIHRQRPSKKIRLFARYVSLLSIQGNPLVFVGINAVMPWTIFFTRRLDQSREQMRESFAFSLQEMSHLESYWCRCIMYRYHSKVFPTIGKEPHFSAQGLFHPLIPPEQVIANDFSFRDGCKTGLITGSNMSGKSTFLRTVGLNQTLAMAGCPVFAESLATWPASVQSCLRVSDSVEDGFSYFYAEVRRIREISDKLDQGFPVLYLVDEVFKGTNNRERLIAAKALLKELVTHDSLGFVTTHDLELSELASSVPEISNFHFSDRFENNQMVFDFTIKDGPCQSTNALKILEQEGLPIA